MIMEIRRMWHNGDQSYFKRRLSDLAMLLVLDSGHIASYESQVPWMTQALREAVNFPFRLTPYHVPLYPSARRMNELNGINHWPKVFDQFSVDLSLEHHDHGLKRTHLLKNNKFDDTGTLYLDDGCMGVKPRPVHPESWYLAKATSEEHFWPGRVTQQSIEMQAINSMGVVLDRVNLISRKSRAKNTSLPVFKGL